MQVAYYGQRDAFRAEMIVADLGSLAVVRQTGTAHRAFRERRDLARATERTYHLVLNRSSFWYAQHRSISRLEAGDAMLFDSGLDTDIRLEAAYDIIHVKMTEAWIRQWLPSPNALVGRAIPVSSGWGRALTSFAAQLSPQFVARSPLPLPVIADHIGALLAFAAAEVSEGPKKGSGSSDSALSNRIQDLIVQRCADPELTAPQIANSVGISLRTLHRCLAAQRKSFGTLLIEARADLALRMLKSTLFRHLSVAQIGQRAGFTDPSHFARVMRSRFGCTPSQLRLAHKDPAPPEAVPSVLQHE